MPASLLTGAPTGQTPTTMPKWWCDEGASDEGACNAASVRKCWSQRLPMISRIGMILYMTIARTLSGFPRRYCLGTSTRLMASALVAAARALKEIS